MKYWANLEILMNLTMQDQSTGLCRRSSPSRTPKQFCIKTFLHTTTDTDPDLQFMHYWVLLWLASSWTSQIWAKGYWVERNRAAHRDPEEALPQLGYWVERNRAAHSDPEAAQPLLAPP